MDFLVNDLSLHGQFHDLPSFQAAVGRIMEIRQIIRQRGSELHCHRNLTQAQVTPSAGMQQAVQGLSLSQRRAWMQWLTTYGPYWEDARVHSGNDWLEVDGAIVTDTAIGEAAICCCKGLPRELVSFDPSAWLSTPVNVRWIGNDQTAEVVRIANHWKVGSVEASLDAHPKPIASWQELADQMERECPNLTFAADTFHRLHPHPFKPAACKQIQVLLHILNRFKGCFNEDGQRNAEGHRVYADYFTGENAQFSDSSATEKNHFRNELTFPHPEDPNRTLFCTWHGKVRTQVLRIHFSWPIRAETPLYVVYVGPKLTKR